jgi:hypothetical protein
MPPYKPLFKPQFKPEYKSSHQLLLFGFQPLLRGRLQHNTLLQAGAVLTVGCGLLIGLLGLSGCQSGPNTTLPVRTSVEGVSEAQRQLIELKLDDLLQLERTQRYSGLYGLTLVPNPTQRAQFLQLAKCAETTLGHVTDVRRNLAKMRLVQPSATAANGGPTAVASTVMTSAQHITVTLPVVRENATIWERWTFKVGVDGQVKFLNLQWLSNYSDFLECAEKVPGVVIKGGHGRKAAQSPKSHTASAAASATSALTKPPVSAHAALPHKAITHKPVLHPHTLVQPSAVQPTTVQPADDQGRQPHHDAQPHAQHAKSPPLRHTKALTAEPVTRHVTTHAATDKHHSSEAAQPEAKPASVSSSSKKH